MPADVELLPKTPMAGQFAKDVPVYDAGQVRAIAAHATAAKDAEIERLRKDVERQERLKGKYILQSAGWEHRAIAYEVYVERMAEMLRKCIDYLPDRGVPGIQKDKALALLRELEEGHEQ